MNTRLALTVAFSALAGGLISGMLLLATVDSPAGARGPAGPAGQVGAAGPQGPFGPSAYRGAYLVTDSAADCPPGTALANVEFQVQHPQGTLFHLCYIK
jgi:hypothetical protein